MSRYSLFGLILILWPMVGLNEFYLRKAPIISHDEAVGIARNAGIENVANALSEENLSIKSIRGMYHLIYDEVVTSITPLDYEPTVPASTPRLMQEKLSLLRYVENKFPFNYKLKSHHRHYLFNYDLQILCILWLLYIYLKTNSLSQVITFLGLSSFALANVSYWRQVTLVLFLTHVYFYYVPITLYGANNRWDIWKNNFRSFLGFNLSKTILPSIFITSMYYILFLIIRVLTSNKQWSIEDYLYPTIFYFIFPWLLIVLITTFFICLHCGICFDENKVYVTSLYKTAIALKLSEIARLEVVKNKLVIQFTDKRPDFVINYFFMNSKVYYQSP